MVEEKITEKSSIDSLELSKRTVTRLKYAQIHAISDLLEYTIVDLKDIRMLGPVGIIEIQDKLQRYGFALPEGIKKVKLRIKKLA